MRRAAGTHGRSLRAVLSMGMVFALVVLALGSTGTLAAWTDEAPVSGTSISTGVLAPPTQVSVAQTCVVGATPTLRSGAGGTSTATGGTSGLTLAKPASAEVGDVLLATITASGNYSSITPTAPSGWNLARRDGVNQMGQFVYTKVVGAAEPADYTWTGFVSNAVGGVGAFSGVDTANPVNATSGSYDATGGTVTAPSVTTTRANVLLVGVFGLLVWSGTQSSPANMTPMWNLGNGAGIAHLAARESWPTPGATGTRTSTHSGSQSMGQLVALQPPQHPYATTTWTPSASTYATGQVFRRTSNAVPQRQATLGPSVSSQTDGPLTTGVSYTMSIVATFNSWTSQEGSTTFTGRTC